MISDHDESVPFKTASLTSTLIRQRLTLCLVDLKQKPGQIYPTPCLASFEQFSRTLEEDVDRGVVLGRLYISGREGACFLMGFIRCGGDLGKDCVESTG